MGAIIAITIGTLFLLGVVFFLGAALGVMWIKRHTSPAALRVEMDKLSRETVRKHTAIYTLVDSYVKQAIATGAISSEHFLVQHNIRKKFNMN